GSFDVEPATVHVSGIINRRCLHRPGCCLYGDQSSLWRQSALEPEPISLFLSASAVACFGLNDDTLGLVQLLRAPFTGMAAVWIWAGAYVGAVSLPWNNDSF